MQNVIGIFTLRNYVAIADLIKNWEDDADYLEMDDCEVTQMVQEADEGEK